MKINDPKFFSLGFFVYIYYVILLTTSANGTVRNKEAGGILRPAPDPASY